MARRKTLLVIVILGLTALFLSPWTKAPVPETPSSAPPEQSPAPVTAVDLSGEEAPADLKVAAVIDEAGYELLQRQSGDFELRHPEIGVHWTRIDPSTVRLPDDIRDIVRASDLLLLPNEWVRNLAAFGELQPVDSVFVGDAQSAQFGAIVAQMKWNGYWWGVPRDLDPYVLMWNRNVLNELKTGGAPLTAPLSAQQWPDLPRLLADNGRTAAWLAIDGSDPLAFLAWIGAATGERQDALFDRTDSVWNDGILTRALQLVDEQRAGIADRHADADFRLAFAAGQYAAAVVRNSEAARMLASLPDSESAALVVDRSVWKTPFVWPNGNSFVLSSHSQADEAAKLWLTEMSAPGRQKEDYEQSGRLPADRSLYASLGGGAAALNAAAAGDFPNQPPLAANPTLPARLDRLGELWRSFLQGSLTSGDWRTQWLDSLADAQADN